MLFLVTMIKHIKLLLYNLLKKKQSPKNLQNGNWQKNKEEIKDFNRKIDIIESGISVAEKNITNGNGQLRTLLQESTLKRDLLQYARSESEIVVKQKRELSDELNVSKKEKKSLIATL